MSLNGLELFLTELTANQLDLLTLDQLILEELGWQEIIDIPRNCVGFVCKKPNSPHYCVKMLYVNKAYVPAITVCLQNLPNLNNV